ncbi:MAG: glycoside hydrolase family 127 protein [Chitinophagaceae bacterium]|nr:glycoside hydrolase family 127 protein [Chitinophagaceae bacterium]
MRYIFVWMFCLMGIAVSAQQIRPLPFEAITIGGEMQTRALKNFDRLESDIYTPEKVFPQKHDHVSDEWPGDYEGRIILGLTLQARATQRTPRYLEELIRLIPQKVNAKGYLGPVMKDSILEQQLSGHGWFLRGLCEYYEWKKDPAVKTVINNIIQNLALPTRGFHKLYPIDPAERNKQTGEAIGTTQSSIGRWKLSSDIGCDFIFMDGVVQAYSVVPSPELKALIDEMVARFLEVDLLAISAQTHATLTGIRALLRYYSLTGEVSLLEQAEKRYLLYRNTAMTENFENYNWFGRPEWTEPCAIVDAYMAANQLWMYTQKPLYIEDAQHIYFNALGHTQRFNGGFGLDNCTNDTTHLLQVRAFEAYWCCTMRGGEGLAKAIQYNYFTGPNTVYVPFFGNNTAEFDLSGRKLILQQTTGYPFTGKVQLTVKQATAGQPVNIALFMPSWTKKIKLSVNGKSVKYTTRDQFLLVHAALKKGDIIDYSFDMQVIAVPLPEKKTMVAKGTLVKFQYGPLILGQTTATELVLKKKPAFVRVSQDKWVSKDKALELSPVYHLLSPVVNEGTGYSKQIIFRIDAK